MKALRVERWLIVPLIFAAAALSACSSTLTMPPDTGFGRDAPVLERSPAAGPPQGAGVSRRAPGDPRITAVDSALSMLGAPYRYGGSTPAGFDCSGLVHYAYGKAGIALPRTTTQLLRASSEISLREAREGDLLFFGIESKSDHVGIFIGNGQFVHAPSSGKQVSIGRLDDPFWRRSLAGVRSIGL